MVAGWEFPRLRALMALENSLFANIERPLAARILLEGLGGVGSEGGKRSPGIVLNGKKGFCWWRVVEGVVCLEMRLF